ncbi:MAG: hypothetical protein WCY01_11075 [Alkalispirochaeta sp.]
MKLQINHRRLIYALITALALTALIGCPPDPEEQMSVSERINAWENAINAGADTAGSHLHPAVDGYDQFQTPDLWTVNFGSTPYDVGEPVQQSGDVYESTITGDNFTQGDKLIFTMREDGKKNWKIAKLVIDYADTNTLDDQVVPQK